MLRNFLVNPGASLTDSQGRTVDFKIHHIIMTGNHGSQYILDLAVMTHSNMKKKCDQHASWMR
jgi:ATP-dependent Clp protease ATP-binding subunit ClpA